MVEEEEEAAAAALAEAVVAAAAASEVAIVDHPEDMVAAVEVAVAALAVAAVEVVVVVVSAETKSNLKIKSTSPDFPVICLKMTLQIFSAPLASSRLTSAPARRRSGSTRTMPQESRKVKPQSPMMILQPLKAPSRGSTARTSTEAASRFKWP